MSDRATLVGSLRLTRRELQEQLRVIDAEARRVGCSSFELRDLSGGFTYAPVLCALAQVEVALLAVDDA